MGDLNTHDTHARSTGTDIGAAHGRPLLGLRFVETGGSHTAGYAGALLAGLGADVLCLRTTAEPGRPWYERGKRVRVVRPDEVDRYVAEAVAGAGFGGVIIAPPDPEPLTDWAQRGALFLRGSEPQAGPGRLLAHLRGAGLAARLLGELTGLPVDVDGDQLLGERVAGRGDRGPTRCRLYRAADGFFAVNLARPDDADLVGAWLALATGETAPEVSTLDGAWAAVDRVASGLRVDTVVRTGQELGLAVTPAPHPRDAAGDAQARVRRQNWPPAPYLIDGRPADASTAGNGPGPPRARNSGGRPAPVVLDLTSLWAGPLVTSLLAAAGARVIKVEGPGRPDGARGGDPRFFDLLNGGKLSVALDLRAAAGRWDLGRLLDRADVVVESLRPRVTEQLGIDPAAWLAGREGRIWVSVTGYGRTGPDRNRVAFGDDAAAAAGVAMLAGDPPRLCGDALGDPVTGLHALVAVLAARVDERSHLVDVALREAVGHALGDVYGDPDCAVPDVGRLRHDGQNWLVDGDPCLVAAMPTARAAQGHAPPLGAHTDAVLSGRL
jgi:crotonobetainyl-CoA:carnitine CoA-transferase CaiB-like acyl-CoA transferase